MGKKKIGNIIKKSMNSVAIRINISNNKDKPLSPDKVILNKTNNSIAKIIKVDKTTKKYMINKVKATIANNIKTNIYNKPKQPLDNIAYNSKENKKENGLNKIKAQKQQIINTGYFNLPIKGKVVTNTKSYFAKSIKNTIKSLNKNQKLTINNKGVNINRELVSQIEICKIKVKKDDKINNDKINNNILKDKTETKTIEKPLEKPLEKQLINYKTDKNYKIDTKDKNDVVVGDPFNIVTGSYLINQCDMIINDILEEVPIERKYQSTNKNVSLIGKGWQLTIFSNLQFNENKKYIKILMFNGKTETFEVTEDKIANIRNDDETLILKKIENGYSLYNNITKQTLIYEKNGLLLYVIDKNGNKRKYIYKENILEKICFPSGQYFKFEIVENKIIKIIDNMNRQIKYTYDGDYLISVEIPNLGIEKYSYNEQGVIESVTNCDGITFVNNMYDEKDRIIYQKLSTGQEYKVIYDDINKINTYIVPKMNRETKYVYNKNNLITKIIYQDKTYEERKYDLWENIVYKKDRLGNETKYTYNKQCLKTEECLPNGLTTYYEYDENNNLTKQWDNLGKEYKYEYDKNGNIIKSTGKIDDKNQLIMLYEYDEYGRIIKEIDPEKREKIFEYNFINEKFNKPTKFITGENNIYNYTYDKAGRCLSVENHCGIKYLEYDAMDIVTKEIDQMGNITIYNYDKMFNLKKVILPNNIEKGLATTYEYDPFNNLLKIEDAEKNIYATSRDYEGNILKEINPNSYNIETNDGKGISYIYDEYDNKIKIIYPDGAIERIKYDANGNMIKKILPEQYDEKIDDGAGYVYEYDCMNRLTKITDARHNVLKKYVYDLKGNIIKEINASGYKLGNDDENKIGILYKYNYMNWLIEKREPITKYQYKLTTYDYDLCGNLIKENRYIEYQEKDSYIGQVHTISFIYDKDNRRIEVSDCTGAVQQYKYNIFNKICSERRKINNNLWQQIDYDYDKAGKLIEIKKILNNEINAITKFEYDKNGNIIKIKTPNGYEIIRQYDSINRLIKERHIEKGIIDNSTTFKYDKASNLIQIIDNNNNKTNIDYDLLNREIRKIEKDNSITRKYYNLNGLLCKVIKPQQYDEKIDDGLGYEYNYNPMGQLTHIIAPNGNIIENNTYDPQGNLLTYLDGEKNKVTFEYDLIGNPTIIRSKGKIKQRFEYDARGNIIQLTDGEENKTNYILDKWGRITSIEKADGSIEKYTYDYIGNITTSIDGENNKTQYIYNSAGKIETIIDANGAKEHYLYDFENRLKEKIDRNGVVTQYGYNMYSSLLYRKTKNNNLQEIYKYSKDGYLESAICNGMIYNYTYDVMGRLESKKASGRNLISYEYDKNGNKIKQIDVTGKITTFKYNLLDLLENVIYNEDNIATYNYYNNGLIKTIKNGSLDEKYKYDEDLNLTGLSIYHNDKLLLENRYAYNNNSNKIFKQENLSNITKYYYTQTNQLSKVRKYEEAFDLNQTLIYEEKLFYDKAGNRTKQIFNGKEQLYNYDNRNRLVSFIKDDKTTYFKWDNCGNLLEDNKGKYIYN